MKKLAILIAAVSLLALTGCGKDTAASVSEEETTAETTTLSLDEKVINLEKLNASYLKKLALTASELPAEALDIPDDWEKLTVNGVSVSLPAGFTVDAEDSTVYDFKSGDVEGYVYFYEADENDVNTLYKYLIEGTDLESIFGSFGLEFDGTVRSLYKNLLKLTAEDLESADEKTKNDLSSFGALFMFTDKMYDLEKDGCELFISDMKDSMKDDDGNDAYSVDIFDDNSELYVVTIGCKDELTALRIAASADLER